MQHAHTTPASSFALTDEELERYRDVGYIGPFPLFDDASIAAVLDEWQRTRDRLPWYKAHHAYRGPILEALSSGAVVQRVASLLGPDVMLWGSQVMAKRGGDTHRWHVDIETMEWMSVNFWAALRNVSRHATVLLLPRTQRLRVSPQELGRTEGLDLEDTAAVQRAAAARGVQSEVVVLDIPPGSFVLFDGHLWHGSVNETQLLRSALLAQFSPTTERAKVPRTYIPPIQWDPEPAPCVLLSGQDRGGGNRYIEPAPLPAHVFDPFGVRRKVERAARKLRSSRPATAIREVSVCIVGTGAAAERHVRALRQLAGIKVRISAVARDHARTSEWIRARAADRAYRSLDEAMSARDDIVVIASPPSSHADYVDVALAANKHVLVEKPAFRTLDELIARIPALRAYSRTFMVAENAHFAPLQRLLLDRIRAGEIGEPMLVRIARLRRRTPPQAWKTAPVESDGALQEGGIHWVRVGLALGGAARASDVEWVFAAEPSRKLLEMHGDDTALATWRLQSGALGELSHSWALDSGRLLLRSSVLGTKGAIHFDVSGRLALLSRGNAWKQIPLVPWGAVRGREDLDGSQAMWTSFLDSAAGRSPVGHTLDEAIADLGVIDAAYRSMSGGAAQRLDARLLSA